MIVLWMVKKINLLNKNLQIKSFHFRVKNLLIYEYPEFLLDKYEKWIPPNGYQHKIKND